MDKRKATGVILTLVGAGIGVWVSLIIADILTFWWVYSSITNVMSDYGISEYIGKIIAVVFAAMVCMVINKILASMAKRNKKWVPMLAGLMAAWFVVMYFVSSPYTSSLFNPFSGKAQAVYLKMPDGKIKAFPKGLKFDPDTGKPLKDFDPATAEEFQKQVGAKKTSSSYFGDSSSIKLTSFMDDIEIRVDKVQVAPDRTVLHFSAGPNSSLDASVVMPRSIYLTDDNGRVINYVSDDVGYENQTIALIYDRKIRPVKVGEIFHYTMTFGALREGTSQLVLHYNQEGTTGSDADLTGLFSRAENIPAIPAPPPPSPPPPSPPVLDKVDLPPPPKETRDDPTLYVLSLGAETTRFHVKDIITRTVKVNRYRRPEEAFKLYGWINETSECKFSSVPAAGPDEVEVTFFRIDPDEVQVGKDFEKVYDVLGLKPDPYAAAAANEADPDLARKYPSITQWRHGQNDWQYQVVIATTDYRDKITFFCGDTPASWSSITSGRTIWWYTGIKK